MVLASSGVAAAQPRQPTAAAPGANPESASQSSGAGASRSTPRSRANVPGRPSTATVVSKTGQAAATPGVPRTRG